MLALNDTQLKQRRFYQEIAEEERQEGFQEGQQEGRQKECISLISRLLQRRIGKDPELNTVFTELYTRSIEQLENLAEALLDFTELDDLRAWLQDHPEEK